MTHTNNINTSRSCHCCVRYLISLCSVFDFFVFACLVFVVFLMFVVFLVFVVFLMFVVFLVFVVFRVFVCLDKYILLFCCTLQIVFFVCFFAILLIVPLVYYSVILFCGVLFLAIQLTKNHKLTQAQPCSLSLQYISLAF